MKLIKTEEPATLIEYKGDFYTPEELAAHLDTMSKFKIELTDNWFNDAITDLGKKND